MVSSLYENNEQSDLVVSGEYGTALYSDQKRVGDNFLWYVKPRMRIDSNYANNINNRLKRVVRVETYNFAGRLIDSLTLLVREFHDINQHYNGNYIENFVDPQTGISILSLFSDSLVMGADSANYYSTIADSHVDYRVYWYGEVDVWLDYVRLDDEWAHFLFTDPNDQLPYTVNRWHFNQKIHDEASVVGNMPGFGYFYFDEFYWNHIPSMKEVNRRVKQFNPNIGIAVMTSYSPGLKNKPNAQQLFAKLNEEGLYDNFIVLDKYPIFSNTPYPSNITLHDSIKNKYTAVTHYVKAQNKDAYNQYLNETVYESNDYVNDYKEAANLVKSSSGSKVFISTVQAHSVETNLVNVACSSNAAWEFRREPTNEEISMQVFFSMCYGAKQIHYFNQFSFAKERVCNNIPEFYCDQGLTSWWQANNQREPRYYNYYGQPKWNFIASLDTNLMKIGKYMYDSNNVIYEATRSVHKDGLPFKYIEGIRSKAPLVSGANPCAEFGAINEYYDCSDKLYWQFGFFNPQSGSSKYFIALNMRCTPNLTNDGDLRELLIKFKASDLPLYNTWKLIDPIKNLTIATFNKNSHMFVSAGTFNPGEGKLFKLEAVTKTGGTLLADENISDESFTCEAPVYNNGHNITIGANTTIHFNDSSKFVMDGGVFTVGNQNISAPQNITSDAVTGSSWRGHSFTNCEVKIYGATFTGLTNDTTYAVNIIDCPVVDIRNCTFNTNSSLKGGINTVFFSDPNNEITLSNIYIGANTFNSTGSTIPTVNISSYAGETTPLIIENNTFNEGNTAIFLSGITGGAIKGNSITDNFIGINALTSAIDIKSNTISSNINSAIGIFAAGGSELKMNNAGSKSLGGLNDISNSGTAANNIVVDGSVFLLDGGQNIFNITDDQSSKHLYGYFPQFTQGPFDETNNCFKLNSTPVDPPYNMVTSGFQGSQITFNFTPYLTGCEANDGGDGFAINLGDGIYDTIYSEGSGNGGGMPVVGQRHAFDLQYAKQKYDSISVLMRYRSYSQARTKCLDLINTYPDSIQSLNAVSKLFLSTVASDTSNNVVNELKIYYEDLILNHGYNTSLVKRANYYILKCKVRMREYTQALAGFQQIINQNPYSYEGLIARWDYMATSLLIQGQSGGFPTLKLRELHSLELREVESYDPDDLSDEASAQSDRSPFTKEQRQDIRKSINTAIEISKDEDDRKIKTLEVKSEQGDVNASKVLEQIRSLKQVVKTEKPKSIVEHVRIVSEDIRKVFGSNTSGKGNEPKNIPMVFRLSQNYPNPFNPVTKINYDLPKDSKVKIVIYDILGREIKRLVNNELKTAGFYIVDFNASNYASGVYFYRIEAEEPNGNKFVDSKKMVLLK